MIIKPFDHPSLHWLWSVFPFLMWIAFFVMPSGGKEPRSRTDKIISAVLGVAVLGFVAYEIYQYVQTH